MVLLTHTNIVVDDFYYGKQRSCFNYIYFLSHMHADHYQGITNKWNYGPIYCSIMTMKVLLNKFPLLPDVRPLEFNKPEEIYLNKQKTLKVKVTLFDANHIAGSAMFLFESHMGTFFHTGDFRFDDYMFKEYKQLYPNPTDFRIPNIPRSIQIDELILDNTYCDPIFQFPKRVKCVKSIIGIIEDNLPCDVYISTYNLGKEEILVELAKHFKTKIVVNNERYKDIICMDFKPEMFTVKPEEGWIFCVKWKDESVPEEVMSRNKKIIKINPTGWANIKDVISVKDGEYIVPYSSHSNFKEIEQFVASLSPAVLKCVVRENQSSFKKIGNIKQLTSYMFTLQNLKQRGYDFLVKAYVNEKTASKNYLKYMNIAAKEELMEALGLKLNESQQIENHRSIFEMKNEQVFRARDKKKLRKGAQLRRPEDNTDLRIEDVLLLNKLKKQEKELRDKIEKDVEKEEEIIKPAKKTKPNEDTDSPEIIRPETLQNIEQN